MITIHKYPLVITGQQGVDIQGYMGCLSAKEQRGKLVLYVMVDTDSALQCKTLSIRIVGTGNVAQTEDYRFVNTVVMKDDARVWHIFIREPK